MPNNAIHACLTLHRLFGLSSRALLLRLLQQVKDPQDCFQLNSATMTSLGLNQAIQQALSTGGSKVAAQVDQDIALLQSAGIELLWFGGPNYPALLQEIADPPPLLYIQGDSSLLAKPQLAIVGSRQCCAQGKENAYRFAHELATASFTITSGLALGIDAEAHRGALDAKRGSTIAVLGTGIDRRYPASHHQLYNRLLAEGGVLVSDFPLGTSPKPGHFPLRNRIISGLSLGVLVIEATERSGSLITARCALEQNREVFALPGSIHYPGSRGCHRLIREGATLVESTADIAEQLTGWQRTTSKPVATVDTTKTLDLDDNERLIIEALGYDPLSVDILQQRCALPLQTLLACLTALELKGVLEQNQGYYQRLG